MTNKDIQEYNILVRKINDLCQATNKITEEEKNHHKRLFLLEEIVKGNSEDIKFTYSELEKILDYLEQGVGGTLTPSQLEALNKAIETQEVEIPNIKSQLDNMVNLEGFETINRKRKKQPLIVFWDDDSLFETRTKLKPLFTSKNVPLTVAVPIKQNQLTVDEMLDLQNNFGWEFSSHSYNHLELPTLTDEQLHYELRESKKWLNERGIKCDALAIPYGKFNDNVFTVARQYYRAIRYSEYGHNYQPYETALKMVQLIENKDFDNETGFYRNSLDFYKYHVDKCFEENTLLILMSHSYAYTDDEIPIISQLIDYVKTKGIQTVTISEALNLSGNLVETGLFFKYGAEKPHLVIGSDGSINSDNIICQKNTLTQISDYQLLPKERIGFVALNNSEALEGGYPLGVAGVLTTYKIGTNRSYMYSYQEYRIMATGDKYFRIRESGSAWGEWKSNIVPIIVDNTITGATIPSSFSTGKVYYSAILKQTAIDTLLPEGLAGSLTTNSLGSRGYKKQTYEIYGTNRTYTRFANEDNATWSAWVEQLNGTRYKDITISDFTVNANSFSNVEVIGVTVTNSTPIAFSVYNASVNCIISHMISGGRLYIRAYNPTSTSVTVSGLRVNCIVY